MNRHADTAFDAELLARHDRPGPRYTSYPPATAFTPDFGAGHYLAAARDSNADPIPRPLSLYVHIPFCLSPCFYCGCTRVVSRDPARSEAYVDALCREIELTAPLFDRDRQVLQLHFGGGTPNVLATPLLARLLRQLQRHFRLQAGPGVEAGMELDPRSTDAAYVASLAGLGFNRISVGVQDFNPQVQQAVNRLQSLEQTRAVVDAARANGMQSVSLDLIYGLPRQTLAGFEQTLHDVIALTPDRIAIYGYAHLPSRVRAQRRIHAGELPDTTLRIALLGAAVRLLGAAGYRHIGLDHFARADDALVAAQQRGQLQRNFQGYSTHAACDLIGLGMSSISHIGASYSQNERELPAYYAALEAGRLPVARGLNLSPDDLVRADAIQQIMCHAQLDIAAFEARHRLHFRSRFATTLRQLAPLAAQGLVTLQPDTIAVTAAGRFLLRVIALCFDNHTGAPATAAVPLSRAI
jgi:oxygen-independent coproporphyrinogen-3 oxidase